RRSHDRPGAAGGVPVRGGAGPAACLDGAGPPVARDRARAAGAQRDAAAARGVRWRGVDRGGLRGRGRDDAVDLCGTGGDDVSEEPREPTEEELRAAFEDQMRRITVDDVLVQ